MRRRNSKPQENANDGQIPTEGGETYIQKFRDQMIKMKQIKRRLSKKVRQMMSASVEQESEEYEQEEELPGVNNIEDFPLVLRSNDQTKLFIESSPRSTSEGEGRLLKKTSRQLHEEDGTDFFFCYRHGPENGYVGLYYHLFTHHKNYTVWFDKYVSQPNLRKMKKGIKKCQVFAVFLTKEIFNGEHVAIEIRTALKYQKPVLLLSHPMTDNKRYISFKSYIDSAPSDIRPIFQIAHCMTLEDDPDRQISLMKDVDDFFVHRDLNQRDQYECGSTVLSGDVSV